MARAPPRPPLHPILLVACAPKVSPCILLPSAPSSLFLPSMPVLPAEFEVDYFRPLPLFFSPSRCLFRLYLEDLMNRAFNLLPPPRWFFSGFADWALSPFSSSLSLRGTLGLLSLRDVFRTMLPCNFALILAHNHPASLLLDSSSFLFCVFFSRNLNTMPLILGSLLSVIAQFVRPFPLTSRLSFTPTCAGGIERLFSFLSLYPRHCIDSFGNNLSQLFSFSWQCPSASPISFPSPI